MDLAAMVRASVRPSAIIRVTTLSGGDSWHNRESQWDIQFRYWNSPGLRIEMNWTSIMIVMRSYQGYYTRSLQNSEVKHLWAGIVLGWVTPREVPVLHPFCFFSSFIFQYKIKAT
jgi:hypothetical protein